MAKFKIDENTWVQNYQYMLKTNLRSLRWLIIFVLLFLIMVMSVILKQYIGAAIIFLFFIGVYKRFFSTNEKQSRKAFSSTSITPLIQEVLFAEESIIIVFDNSKFVIDWKGIEKVVRLPDLVFVRHKLLQFYFLSSALTPDEWSTFERKISSQKIFVEDRRKNDNENSVNRGS
jgi:hypothetical protein